MPLYKLSKKKLSRSTNKRYSESLCMMSLQPGDLLRPTVVRTEFLLENMCLLLGICFNMCVNYRPALCGVSRGLPYAWYRSVVYSGYSNILQYSHLAISHFKDANDEILFQTRTLLPCSMCQAVLHETKKLFPRDGIWRKTVAGFLCRLEAYDSIRRHIHSEQD